MPRTDVDSVRALLAPGGDYDDINKPTLVPFIETASLIVDRVKTCAIDKGKDLTTAELELIERWLSAHFYVQSDQAYQSKSTSGASGSFQGQVGEGLQNSKYGAAALSLDYSGCLLAISGGADRRTAGAIWLGKPRSTQIDYAQRD